MLVSYNAITIQCHYNVILRLPTYVTTLRCKCNAIPQCCANTTFLATALQCYCNTMLLQYDATTTPYGYNTIQIQYKAVMRLQRNNTLLSQCNATALQCYCNHTLTMLLPHNATPTQCYYNTMLLQYNVTTIQYHNVTAIGCYYKSMLIQYTDITEDCHYNTMVLQYHTTKPPQCNDTSLQRYYNIMPLQYIATTIQVYNATARH